jgi:phosphoglycolate phosphatase
MQTQLLIFDLDGTLVDSRADLTAGINHMRSHFGWGALSLESVSGYIGSGVRDLVERSLRGMDVPFEEALQINKAYYNSHLTVHTTTYPGVREGIRKLSQAGHQLALLTNKPGDASRLIIKHFGLDDFFVSVIGGGDVENLKPEPDGVFECLAVAGLDASRVWMIGDHHTDLIVAKNAGIKSAFAKYGFEDKLDCEPNISFDSFPELVDFFIT